MLFASPVHGAAIGKFKSVLQRGAEMIPAIAVLTSLLILHNTHATTPRELFEGNFPADFVAEGLDQTRGW